MIKSIFHILSLFLTLTCSSFAQDIEQTISRGDTYNQTPELFGESIRIISRSRKIFVITNTNQMMSKGDFITITFDESSPVARALVAKNHDGLVGIKIMKIYSLQRWTKLHQDMDVKIVKGDDSFLFKKKTEQPKNSIASEKIDAEEDLYNDKFLDGSDENLNNNAKRLIKPDNLVGFSWGFPSYTDIDDNVIRVNELGVQWGYQFLDNIWAEGGFEFARINNFPNSNIQTTTNTISLKLKYIFNAPMNSYVLPYVGASSTSVASNKASAGQVTDTVSALEDNIISDLQGNSFIIGVTLLTRMVPGWFIKADLSLNSFNFGAAVEF